MINCLKNVRNFLKECEEKNRTIRFDSSEDNKNLSSKNKLDQTNNDFFDEKLFKEFYITMFEVKIMEKSLGYVIQLDPCNNGEYLNENKHISYDPESYQFSIGPWKFVHPANLKSLLFFIFS